MSKYQTSLLFFLNFIYYLNVYAKWYVSEVYTDHDKVDLLPPSAFETHTVDAAWKELARATNEVMQLKLENQKLRYFLSLLAVDHCSLSQS